MTIEVPSCAGRWNLVVLLAVDIVEPGPGVIFDAVSDFEALLSRPPRDSMFEMWSWLRMLEALARRAGWNWVVEFMMEAVAAECIVVWSPTVLEVRCRLVAIGAGLRLGSCICISHSLSFDVVCMI